MVRLPSPPPHRSENQKEAERSFGGFDWTEALTLCVMGGLADWNFDKAYEKHQRRSEERQQQREGRSRSERGGGRDDGRRGGRSERSERSRRDRTDRYRDEERRGAKRAGDYRSGYAFDARDERRSEGERSSSRRGGHHETPSRVESWVYGDNGSAPRDEGRRRSSRRDDRRESW